MLSFLITATCIVRFMHVCAQDVIDSDLYFYGQSPLVKPPRATGAGNWSAAYAKAKSFVAQLTLDEKINFTSGVTPDNGCAG